MVLFLGENDVKKLLYMPEALEVIEDTFSQHGPYTVVNNPRQRVRTGSSMLHYLAAAVPHLGVMGYKAYTSSKSGLKFRVFLHDIETGELLSIMDGNYMGMIRTGAVTGVATKYMSRNDSSVLGVYGTGFQAEGQILAICSVRNIERIKVYGRNRDRREKFCQRISGSEGCEINSAETPEAVLEGSDIIVTATTSSQPVFNGEYLENGVHINAIGGNFLFKREIDEKTVLKSDIITVENIEQTKLEAGEFMPVIEKGRMFWENLNEISDIISGRVHGRNTDDEITLFKSVGIACEDIALAHFIYRLALESKTGKNIDIPSL